MKLFRWLLLALLAWSLDREGEAVEFVETKSIWLCVGDGRWHSVTVVRSFSPLSRWWFVGRN